MIISYKSYYSCFWFTAETDPTLSFEPQVLTRHQFAKYVCNRRRSKRAEIIYKEAVVSGEMAEPSETEGGGACSPQILAAIGVENFPSHDIYFCFFHQILAAISRNPVGAKLNELLFLFALPDF